MKTPQYYVEFYAESDVLQSITLNTCYTTCYTTCYSTRTLPRPATRTELRKSIFPDKCCNYLIDGVGGQKRNTQTQNLLCFDAEQSATLTLPRHDLNRDKQLSVAETYRGRAVESGNPVPSTRLL